MKTALEFLIEDKGYFHYKEDSSPIIPIPTMARIMEEYAQQFKDQIELMKDPNFHRASYDVKFINRYSKTGGK